MSRHLLIALSIFVTIMFIIYVTDTEMWDARRKGMILFLFLFFLMFWLVM